MSIARRRRDEVAHVTQTPANMGTDIMRFARLDMHEVEEFRIEGRGARRRPSARPRRRRARRRAPHDARLRGWRLRRPRVAPRRLGRVDEPERAHRVACADRAAADRRRGCCAKAATTSSRRCRSRTPRPAALVMDGVLTSAILVPENGPPVWKRPLRIGYPDEPMSTTCRWSVARRIATSTRRGRDGPPRHACATRGESSTAVWSRRSSTSRPSTRQVEGRHRRRAALPRAEPRRSGARDRAVARSVVRDGTCCASRSRDVGDRPRRTAVARSSPSVRREHDGQMVDSGHERVRRTLRRRARGDAQIGQPQ